MICYVAIYQVGAVGCDHDLPGGHAASLATAAPAAPAA